MFTLYREWKEKFNLEDNEQEDILKYNFKNTFIFRPDLSGPGLTGAEVITMPHPCNLLDFVLQIDIRIYIFSHNNSVSFEIFPNSGNGHGISH